MEEEHKKFQTVIAAAGLAGRASDGNTCIMSVFELADEGANSKPPPTNDKIAGITHMVRIGQVSISPCQACGWC
jgi:hypothetical protein